VIIPSFPLKKTKKCIFCGIDLFLNKGFEFVYKEIICYPCYDELEIMPVGPEHIYEIIKCRKFKVYKDFSVITLNDKKHLLLFPMISHIRCNSE
jgi:hypothetical protein